MLQQSFHSCNYRKLNICLNPVEPVEVGLMGRTRLYRELPIFKKLKGAVKITPSKQRNRTLIDMSLSINSIDLDYASGVFKTHGWMVLKWNDPRNSWVYSCWTKKDFVTS